jgi:hypothetical protein
MKDVDKLIYSIVYDDAQYYARRDEYMYVVMQLAEIAM